mmetsp:Transcript_524/g.1684  ORF Transcript_524/g.1684 Transcript_524/m.1684 type:complete len:212 (+) Transcript_524:2238-2873(+)
MCCCCEASLRLPLAQSLLLPTCRLSCAHLASTMVGVVGWGDNKIGAVIHRFAFPLYDDHVLTNCSREVVCRRGPGSKPPETFAMLGLAVENPSFGPRQFMAMQLALARRSGNASTRWAMQVRENLFAVIVANKATMHLLFLPAAKLSATGKARSLRDVITAVEMANSALIVKRVARWFFAALCLASIDLGGRNRGLPWRIGAIAVLAEASA